MKDRLQAIKNPRDFPCPYRKGQLRNVFMIHVLPAPGQEGWKPAMKDSADLHQLFMPQGLSGGTLHVIGNNCQACHSCVPLRIRTKDYHFSHNEKHLFKHNAAVSVTTGPVHIGFEHYALYLKYLKHRHPENGHWDMDELKQQLVPHTHMMEIRDKGKLLGVTIMDLLETSLNAFQIFYDPDESNNKRSIGTLCFLKLIEFAQAQKRDHVYIGSWVADSPKLNYKKRFQNLEALTDQGWVKFDPALHITGPDLVKNIPPGTPWVVSP